MKIAQFIRQGDLICIVNEHLEDSSLMTDHEFDEQLSARRRDVDKFISLGDKVAINLKQRGENAQLVHKVLHLAMRNKPEFESSWIELKSSLLSLLDENVESSTKTNHWVGIALRSKATTRRDRARFVFSKLDGKEQNSLLDEFSKSTEYRGTKYPTAREAAVAKIMRVLETKRA